MHVCSRYACMYVKYSLRDRYEYIRALSVLGQFFVRKITNTRTELDASEVAANSYTDSTSQIYHICRNALIQI